MSNVKINYNQQGFKDLEDKAILYLETIAENIRIEAKSIVNVDTGKLKDSIQVIPIDKWKRQIGSDVEYAPYQELGTARLHSIPSYRPYLRPALWNVINKL